MVGGGKKNIITVKYVVKTTFNTMEIKMTTSLIKEKTKNMTNFPKLYVHTTRGSVILFVSEKAGTVVATDEENKLRTKPLGYYNDNWISCFDTYYFRPFYGTVMLTGD